MVRWSRERSGRRDIAVAVIDGPVDTGHACFAGAVLEFPLGQPAFGIRSAAAGHGTHVASILFGQPGGPVRGMAPRARGIVIPVFSGDGAEGLRCSQLDLARAIGAALESGAAIINISGGQLMPECEPDADLRGALAACEARRVLVVAAAGNDGCDRGQVPACVPGVLAVAAAGVDGRPLATSNWGEAHRRHGVLAPGENIIGAVPGGGTAEKTGTSFAAPIVSGIAAAMLMREIAAGRDADPLKLRGALAGKRVTRDGRIVPLAAPAAIHQTGKAGRTDMSMQDADQAEGFAAVLEQEQARSFAPPAATGAWPPAVTAAEHAARPASADAVEAACAGKACGCGGAGDCGCGCGGARKAAIDAPPALVYALGQIGFDYASEARRDSIAQFMRGRSPSDEKAVLAYLSTGGGAEDIERMIWTIRLDSTPIYAIQPVGAFAAGGYARILQAYRLQLEKDVPLVAVPGRIAGSVRLMSGETVPVIVPAARGILSWDVADAVESFIDEFAKSISRDATEEEGAAHEGETQAMRDKLPGLLADFRNLMTRKYRNLGLAGRERALNFASTAAFRVYQVLTEIAHSGFVLDDIAVARSAACRTGSDCYDVQLRMFVPSDISASLRIFQFTVDVSDTMPVHIGEVSSWNERPKG